MNRSARASSPAGRRAPLHRARIVGLACVLLVAAAAPACCPGACGAAGERDGLLLGEACGLNPRAPAERSRWKLYSGIAASTLGAIGVGVGGGHFVLRDEARDDATRASSARQADNLRDRAASHHETATWLVGTGAPLMAAGLTLLIVDLVEASRGPRPGADGADVGAAPRVVPTASPNGLGLAGRF